MREKIGFGTCRVSAKNPEHLDALVYALQKGVGLVDATAGDSERAVGEALRRSKVAREKVILVSKAGCIEGSLLQQAQTGEVEAQEAAPRREEWRHRIHPDFLKRQLDESLERLGTGYVDTCLLHNPEYFLMHAIESPGDVEPARKEMDRRLLEAFVALEEEAQKGRIRNYGISSDAFAKPPDDLHFLPYARLLKLAEEAAAETGAPSPHLSTVQLPVNLLEPEGLKCAAWAKANGLTVLVNRPLDAFDGKGMRRLASYPAPETYEAAREALLLAADTYSLSELRTVVTDLDAIRHRFDWPGVAEETLQRRVIPFIRGILGRIPDPAVKKAVIPLLNPFLQNWQRSVAHLCGEKTLGYLPDKGVRVSRPIQHAALRWLLDRPEIDTVLLGMRKKAYVDDALELTGS